MATTAALQLQPRLRLQPTTVPPGPDHPVRPRLRVLDGGRAPGVRARRAIYLRRRLVVAAVVLVVAVATLLLASAAVAGIAGGGTPSAATGDASPTPAAATSAAGVAATHVVQPGDTLWSIAAAAAPGVDVRITVDRLAELNGRGALVVGQRLLLP